MGRNTELMNISDSVQTSYKGTISPTNLLLAKFAWEKRSVRRLEEFFLAGVNLVHKHSAHRVNCSGLCGLAHVTSP